MSSLSFSNFEYKLNAKFIAAIQLLAAHFNVTVSVCENQCVENDLSG